MPDEKSLIESVRQLSAEELEQLLRKRKADDAALRALWRAALSREREQRRQEREGSLD
jgi:hypothetical protein